MALQLLLTSTGFAFYEHTCNMTFSKKVSLEPQEACCDLQAVEAETPSHIPQFKQASCCESHLNYQKVDTQTDNGIQFLKGLHAPAFLPLEVPSFPGLDNGLALPQKSGNHPPVNAPPGISSPALPLLCVWRI